MDVEYTWTLGQGEKCHQFRLLTWTITSFIGKFVHPVRADARGWIRGGRYFSLLTFSVIRLHDNLVLDSSNYKSINSYLFYFRSIKA